MTLNLPEKMDFSMGTTEQKMDMKLDDIIKQSRKKFVRAPIKGRFKNQNNAGRKVGNNPAARAALQRSVAARSSNLRQGKFAEARARNGAGNFAATKAAGKKALVTPITGRNRAWVKRGEPRQGNFGGQRPAPVQKRGPFNASPGNMKISVVNNGSKVGGQRPTVQPFRTKRNGPNIPARQVLTGQKLNSDRMDVDYTQTQVQKPKARTLDSLFAEIKERRNVQPIVIQPFSARGQTFSARGQTFSGRGRGSQRGGRGSFPGRRWQQQ